MLMLCRHLKCPASCSRPSSPHWDSSALAFTPPTVNIRALSIPFLFFPGSSGDSNMTITQRSPWSMVQAGALWGLSALGGYPAIVILDPIFLTFRALGRTWFVQGEFACWPKRNNSTKAALFSDWLIPDGRDRRSRDESLLYRFPRIYEGLHSPYWRTQSATGRRGPSAAPGTTHGCKPLSLPF